MAKAEGFYAEVFKVLSRRGFLAIRKARIREAAMSEPASDILAAVRFHGSQYGEVNSPSEPPPNKKRRPYRSLKFFSSLSPLSPLSSPAPLLPCSLLPILCILSD